MWGHLKILSSTSFSNSYNPTYLRPVIVSPGAFFIEASRFVAPESCNQKSTPRIKKLNRRGSSLSPVVINIGMLRNETNNGDPGRLSHYWYVSEHIRESREIMPKKEQLLLK